MLQYEMLNSPGVQSHLLISAELLGIANATLIQWKILPTKTRLDHHQAAHFARCSTCIPPAQTQKKLQTTDSSARLHVTNAKAKAGKS